MKQTNRRTFLKHTALGTAALSFSARSWSQVPGANSDIRVAIIGFNGQGKSHISSLKDVAGARIVALCDVDQRVLDGQAETLAKAGNPVETFKDIRKLLESKNIDAVSIATPNHWHALAAIWAIQAGKDVYVEKPVSHNVSEGRRIVEAARKHDKVVQTGTQIRSSSGIREAVAWVQEGHLGKIKIARGLCYKPRQSIGKAEGAQQAPDTVDYDLWIGPAEKTPLTRKRLHYDWHWVWNTGNGDLGNQGIHQMDIARWFLGVNELAPSVFSVGGRLAYQDDGETPNTQIVYQGYEKAPLIFEVRGLPKGKDFHKPELWNKNMDTYKGAGIGVVIECEHGYVRVPNYTSAIAFDKEGVEIQKFSGSENHHGNFIKAVRNRKPSELNADILEGHLSSALCHTGNISYRLGAGQSPEKIRESIKGQPGAQETFNRMAEHLVANGVDLEKDKLTLGVPLKMDPATEKFTNNKKANEMLTREYRKGFEVPAKV